ncbi:hypothetical protein QBC38DRAFT_488483 [Podospora fimiseda]|uniref:Outer spore wall protein RRT8 n=1 Tax=Podospora fimiseda TaxID=252190 RepID=A0AAN7BGW4_9PEZI|nr:hypothetical protein QBC38DRAFT_488483 [Podospora fimiseda]
MSPPPDETTPLRSAAPAGQQVRSPTTTRRRIFNSLRPAMYPITGIWYFLQHREFWPIFVAWLLPLVLITTVVYGLLFAFAWLPQYLFLAILFKFQGKAGAAINATFLVLGEGMVVIQAIFEACCADQDRVKIFDAVLINHGFIDLIAPHRVLYPDAPNSVKRLGKPITRAEYNPWSFTQIFEMIVCLPLNLVPVIGTPAFIMITGARMGKLSHYRWYTLRGIPKKEMKKDLHNRSWEYLWFGTVAMLLELVPFLNFLFLLTSAAGAAIWASELEKRSRVRVGRHISDSERRALLPQQAHEDGPVYHDDLV